MASQELIVKIILPLLHQLKIQEQGIRTTHDIECVHQMRVMSRRLRNAVRTLKDFFPRSDRERWIKSIRAMTDALSEARDMDVKIVFVENLSRHRAGLSYINGLKKFIAILKCRRNKLQPLVIKALDRWEKQRTLLSIENALKKTSVVSPQELKQKILSSADARILKKLKDLLAFRRYVYQPRQIKKLHLMRIAAKNLRYTLETLKPFYGSQKDAFIEEVYALQRTLGAMHDVDAWLMALPRLIPSTVKSDKELKAALRYFKNECRKLRQEKYNDFVKAWNNFSWKNALM